MSKPLEADSLSPRTQSRILIEPVPDTKENGALIGRLAQQTIAHSFIPMARPEATSDLLTLKKVDIAPPGSSARTYLSLKNELQLSVLENLLIQGMFKGWHLSGHLNLLDLFGVELYRDITALGDQFFRKHDTDQLLSRYAPWMFGAYLRSCREDYHPLPLHEEHTKKFFPTKIRVIEELNALCLNIELLIVTCKNDELSRLPSNGNKREQALKQIEERYAKGETALKRFKAKVNLFVKILSREDGSRVLVNNALNCFEGYQSIEHPQIEKREKTLTDLSLFCDYCESLFARSLKLRLCSIYLPLFKEYQKMVEALKAPPFSPERIGALKRQLIPIFAELTGLLATAQTELEEAEQGLLTHEQWLAKRKIPSSGTKPQELFIEQMLQNWDALSYLSQLAQTVQDILDSQVFQPAFPEYAPLLTVQQRFVGNLVAAPQTVPQKEFRPLSHPLAEEFRQHYCKLIAPIEGLFGSVLQTKEFNQFRTNEAVNALQGTYAAALWIQHLHPFRSTGPLLTRAKEELAKLPEQLLAFLKERVQTMPPLSEEAQKQLAEEIQDVCCEDSLFLVRMMMLFEDVNTILNEGHEFRLSRKYLADELADAMVLTGLREALDRPATPEPEIEEELPLEQPPLPPVQVEPPAQEAPKIIITPVLPRPIKIVSPKPSSKPKPKIYPPLPPEMIRERKTRIIEAMLRRSGFFPRESDHRVFADQHGRIVPVPRRPEQRSGTVQNMYELGTASIKSQRPDQKQDRD